MYPSFSRENYLSPLQNLTLLRMSEPMSSSKKRIRLMTSPKEKRGRLPRKLDEKRNPAGCLSSKQAIHHIFSPTPHTQTHAVACTTTYSSLTPFPLLLALCLIRGAVQCSILSMLLLLYSNRIQRLPSKRTTITSWKLHCSTPPRLSLRIRD